MAHEMNDPHPVFPIRRNVRHKEPVCPHTYLDASNICLDCGEFIPSSGGRDIIDDDPADERREL